MFYPFLKLEGVFHIIVINLEIFNYCNYYNDHSNLNNFI